MTKVSESNINKKCAVYVIASVRIKEIIKIIQLLNDCI